MHPVHILEYYIIVYGEASIFFCLYNTISSCFFTQDISEIKLSDAFLNLV